MINGYMFFPDKTVQITKNGTQNDKETIDFFNSLMNQGRIKGYLMLMDFKKENKDYEN